MPKQFLARLRWELGLLVVVLLLCVIPSAGMFRFSFRWLALFHLVLVITAAETFRLWTQPLVRFSTWFLPGIAFVTLLLTYTRLNPHAPVAHYFFTDNLNSPAPLDPNRLYLSLYPAPQSWYRVDMPGGPFGAVVRPGSTSMFGGVHLINGYTPVAPVGVARFFNCATHGQIDPARVRDVVIPEAGPGGLMEKLGIDGIIVARNFQLPAPLPNEWKLVYSEEEGDVYHRAQPLPTVRALADENHTEAQVQIVENSRQKIVADILPDDSTRPALLGFSRPYFPGYRASLNGRQLAVASLQGLAPTVEIPAGQNGRLELSYRPRAVVWGTGVAVLSFIAGAAMLAFGRR
jgi:hypothetical protein